MRIVEKTRALPVRQGGHPLGVHRVVEPSGVLPQAAKRLDTGLPIFENETLIEVDRLKLDSASFHQIQEECGGQDEAIAKHILQITRERGKMHNPVTGSGGMLIGTVVGTGSKSGQPYGEGDRIATLVSLTLTPLYLEEIHSIEAVHGQVAVTGHAILFASGIAAKMPEDIEENTALSLFDVCGAPAWVRKKVKPGDKVLVLGMGKAGTLSALAALEVIPKESLWVSDRDPKTIEAVLQNGLGSNAILGDVSNPLAFQEKLNHSGAPGFDWVIDTCNIPELETTSILAAKEKGGIIYFNMATNFGRAVLSAEGIGKEVEMVMGNGFVEGHWQYALSLMRRNKKICQRLIA